MCQIYQTVAMKVNIKQHKHSKLMSKQNIKNIKTQKQECHNPQNKAQNHCVSLKSAEN